MKPDDKRFALFWILASISIVAVSITFLYHIEFSTFAVAVAKVAMAVILFWIIDKTLLNEIDTIDELKYHKNISYGLFVCGLWVALGLLISTA